MATPLKKFAETLDASYEAVKFWGKVTASSGDYFVCYGKTSEDTEEDPKKQEGKNGANKYTYFVTKSPADPWTQLPHVTSAQVLVASSIRRLLTGDLDAGVPSYPPFPGTERSYLRAMIARVTADCAIAPAGTFEASEDGDIAPVRDDDGNVNPPNKECEELLTKEAWTHYELRLNVLGRCTKLPEQEEEGAEPVEGDDVPEALGGVEAEEGKDRWSLRPCPGGAGQTATSLVKAVSLDWPGAYAVAGGKRFVNVYVGNGLKFENKAYTPPLPGGIAQEFVMGAGPAAEGETPEEPVYGQFPLEAKDVVVDPTPPAVEGEEE